MQTIRDVDATWNAGADIPVWPIGDSALIFPNGDLDSRETWRITFIGAMEWTYTCKTVSPRRTVWQCVEVPGYTIVMAVKTRDGISYVAVFSLFGDDTGQTVQSYRQSTTYPDWSVSQLVDKTVWQIELDYLRMLKDTLCQ